MKTPRKLSKKSLEFLAVLPWLKRCNSLEFVQLCRRKRRAEAGLFDYTKSRVGRQV